MTDLDGYELIQSPPTPDGPPGHRTKRDVYRWLNDHARVSLCISCAVKRRMDGTVVELVDDRRTNAKCVDCREKSDET